MNGVLDGGAGAGYRESPARCRRTGKRRDMAERSYRGLLAALAIVGVAADQASKYGVFRWLYQHPQLYSAERMAGEYDVVPGWFKLLAQFTPASSDTGTGPAATLRAWNGPYLPRVNHGALFGLGNDHTFLANLFFLTVSVTAAAAIIGWSFRKNTARDGLLCAALGLILAGTLGNLYDRLVFNGVRDFLYFYKVEWPVFNVADCFLVCGAGLLLLQAMLSKQPAAEPKPAPAPSEAVA